MNPIYRKLYIISNGWDSIICKGCSHLYAAVYISAVHQYLIFFLGFRKWCQGYVQGTLIGFLCLKLSFKLAQAAWANTWAQCRLHSSDFQRPCYRYGHVELDPWLSQYPLSLQVAQTVDYTIASILSCILFGFWAQWIWCLLGLSLKKTIHIFCRELLLIRYPEEP